MFLKKPLKEVTLMQPMNPSTMYCATAVALSSLVHSAVDDVDQPTGLRLRLYTLSF